MAGDAMDARILDEAADWLVLWHDQGMTEAECADFERWRARSPAHRQAWARAELLMGRLGDLPRDWAMPVLDRPVRHARPSRRQVVAKLAALLAVAPTAWLGWQWAGEQGWTADVHTATGEQRHLTLADGSRLDLNTDTRVDIRFDAGQRLIHLRHGEILVETAKDSRPLSVQTDQGRILALGTRFVVRQDDGTTRVTVEAHAVEVRPRLATQQVVRIDAGQTVSVAADAVGPLQPAPAQASSWAQGMLVAVDWRLQDVLAELSRYRPGYLGCAPEVADLRLSGAFTLDDSDAVLANLEDSLPVKVRRLTRYWVRLEARAT